MADADFVKLLYDRIPGIEVYVVGGAIRDGLLRHSNKYVHIKDFDLLARKASFEEIAAALSEITTVKEVGKAFGVLTFHPPGMDKEIEIALPRTEESTGPEYRDFEVVVDQDAPLDVDLARRDATINAMAMQITSVSQLTDYHVTLSKIVDPFGGMDDLKYGVWKAVGDPYKRFLEDPTRIMRALRQCATKSLELDQTTWTAMLDHANVMESIPPKSRVRLTTEFVKILGGKNDQKIVELILRHPQISSQLHIAPEDKVAEKNAIDLYKIISSKYNSGGHNIVVRLAAILINKPDWKDWIENWQLSAVDGFDRQWVPALSAIIEFSNAEKLAGMRWMVSDFRKAVPHSAREMVEYCVTLTRMKQYVEESAAIVWIDVIASEAELALDGFRIGKDLDGISPAIAAPQYRRNRGKLIGDLKTYLFHLVVDGELENDADGLRRHLMATDKLVWKPPATD